MEKNYYVIAGYDLTGWETDKFDGEKYMGYQSKGHIQLFDDPMSGSHLYFGYVLANGDEYDFDTTKFNVNDVNGVLGDVKSELIKLIELGVISMSPQLKPEYQIITFEECT